MKTHFITGAAQSVTNSVERFTALRQQHPEWDEKPSEKAVARERLAPAAEPAVDGDASDLGARPDLHRLELPL
jgi:hypothetical protein